MRLAPRRRRPLVTVAVVAVAAFGMASPTHAEEDGPVPESCRPHPAQLVNPGCAPALTSEVRNPGITLPNLRPDVRNVQVLRPFVLDEATQTFVQGGPELAFDGWVQNFGDVALEIVADDPSNPTTALQ